MAKDLLEKNIGPVLSIVFYFIDNQLPLEIFDTVVYLDTTNVISFI